MVSRHVLPRSGIVIFHHNSFTSHNRRGSAFASLPPTASFNWEGCRRCTKIWRLYSSSWRNPRDSTLVIAAPHRRCATRRNVGNITDCFCRPSLNDLRPLRTQIATWETTTTEVKVAQTNRPDLFGKAAGLEPHPAKAETPLMSSIPFRLGIGKHQLKTPTVRVPFCNHQQCQVSPQRRQQLLALSCAPPATEVKMW